jgi:hypothetical protein
MKPILTVILVMIVIHVGCNNPSTHEKNAITVGQCPLASDSNFISNQELQQMADLNRSGVVLEPCYSSVDTISIRFSLVHTDTVTVQVLSDDGNIIRSPMNYSICFPGIYTLGCFIGNTDRIFGIKIVSRTINEEYWIKK